MLRAALGSGQDAVEAYRAWRASVLLDDIDWPTFRLLPLLDATAKRHGIVDADAKRIEGAAKHIWLSNTLRLNSLIAAVDALQAAGIEVLLLKGAALFARDPEQIGLRATGDYDVMVRDADKRAAVAALDKAGFRPLVYQPERFTDRDFEVMHAAAFTWGERAQRGQVDLHWRPSGDFPAPGLSELLFSAAEFAKIGNTTVAIPCLADHLFVGLMHANSAARTDRIDWFVEAAQILQRSGARIDWNRIALLCRRYEVSDVAVQALSSLNECVPGLIPAERIRQLESQVSAFERIEHRLRKADRASIFRQLAMRLLDRTRAQRRDRSLLGTMLALATARGGWDKAMAALTCSLPDTYTRLQLRRMWRLADGRPRLDGVGQYEPEFLLGWSVPEKTGRWSDGRFQLVRVSSALERSSLVVVRLRVRAYIPNEKWRVRVGFYAGADELELTLGAERPWPSIIEVPGCVRKDGTVAIAMKVFNPIAPAALGMSDDPRALGIFVERVELAP